MGDSDNTFQPSKKRAAGKDLNRDNNGLDDDDESEQETGTFKKASEEVLSGRRIVKVRRSAVPSAPSSNPFAGIRLVPYTEPSAKPAESIATPVEALPKAVSEAKIDAIKETSGDKNEHTVPAEAKETDATKETDTEPGTNPTESKANLAEVTPEAVSEAKLDSIKEPEGAKDEHTIREDAKSDASKETDNGNDKKANQENNASKGTGKEDESGKQSETKIDGPVAEATVESTEVKEIHDEKESVGDAFKKEGKKDSTSENGEQNAGGTSLNSFQQLSSSKNAFTGFSGTGFSNTTFSFGSLSKDGSVSGTGSGSIFGLKGDQPIFGFGASDNGNSSLFKASPSIISKSEGTRFPSMNEVTVETGEENERVAFSADSVVFEFLDGRWKERGKGEVKVNVSTTGSEKARLVMRAKGNYRLILNASLFPDIKLTSMDKKGITFACMNSTGEGKDGWSTFALKFKDPTIVAEFSDVVATHKGKTEAVLKTPENSPKAPES